MSRRLSSGIWVAGFDLHYPKYDDATLKVLLEFLRLNKVEGFIFGGDQFDNSEISHHNKDKALYKPEGFFKANERGFDDEVLKPIEKAIGRKAKKVWIVGNHDRWETDMDEHTPELAGCFDRTYNLRLRERGWKVIDNGKAYQLGKLAVIHGDQLSTGFGLGIYPTRRALDIYMQNVLFGHVHYAQSFSKVSPVEHSQKYMGWSAPCMCNLNPAYMKNKPSAWMNGFVIIEVLPSGDFWVHPVVVVKGKFSYGGLVYGA